MEQLQGAKSGGWAGERAQEQYAGQSTKAPALTRSTSSWRPPPSPGHAMPITRPAGEERRLTQPPANCACPSQSSIRGLATSQSAIRQELDFFLAFIVRRGLDPSCRSSEVIPARGGSRRSPNIAGLGVFPGRDWCIHALAPERQVQSAKVQKGKSISLLSFILP